MFGFISTKLKKLRLCKLLFKLRLQQTKKLILKPLIRWKHIKIKQKKVKELQYFPVMYDLFLK